MIQFQSEDGFFTIPKIISKQKNGKLTGSTLKSRIKRVRFEVNRDDGTEKRDNPS